MTMSGNPNFNVKLILSGDGTAEHKSIAAMASDVNGLTESMIPDNGYITVKGKGEYSIRKELTLLLLCLKWFTNVRNRFYSSSQNKWALTEFLKNSTVRNCA